MPKLGLGRAQGGIAVISTGTVAGQVVTLLATPMLSRIYSPAAYGTYASLMALVAIASTAGSLRLDTAIPIATEGEARSLLKTSTWSSLLAGVLCAVTLTVVGHQAIVSDPWVGSLLVVYLVWVTAMYSVLTAYSLRSHQYTAVARRNLLQALGTSGGQLVFSRLLKSALGLTAGLAFGRSLGVASLVKESQLLSRGSPTQVPKLLLTVRRYWRFPAIFMPSALLNVLGTQLPILIVARIYGPESAGNLAQALVFGAIPASLLGAAISSVVMAEMAARVRNGELNQRARYLRVTRALLPIGIVWFLVIIIAGAPLLPLVLGPQWSDSGAYLAALAVAAVTGLVVSPLSIVFVLYERALANVLLDIARVVLVAGLGGAAWALGYGPVASVFIMSLGMAVVYVAIWLLGLRTVSPHGSSEPEAFRPEERG